MDESQNQSIFSSIKKERVSGSSKEYSIKFDLKVLTIKGIILSIIIAFSLAFIAFLVQAKIGLKKEITNFLVFGRDNITTVNRELGYDQLVGFDYAIEHLYDKFKFTRVQILDKFDSDSCLYRKKYCVRPRLRPSKALQSYFQRPII